MRILSVGGGSGGHVTPVAAVLSEIKKQHPDAELRFWVDRNFAHQAREVMGDFDDSVRVDVVVSGKLRRYHKLSVWRQLLRFRTIVIPNLIDMLKVAIGFVQSLGKLIIWRPDVVFTKGGYVCLPVGLAARVLRIPLVIHDSDAHPGLTNRILARWANKIGTGAPLEYYPYPESITKYVGVPIMADFKPYSDKDRSVIKQKLGFSENRPLVVVTGGGLGAQRLNTAVVDEVSEITNFADILLITGTAQYDEVREKIPKDTKHVQVKDFISSGLVDILGAADVAVARAGATTILELAALAKPTILVPNLFLTGGHQLKNAKVYEEKGAVKVIDELELEKDSNILTKAVKEVIDNQNHAKKMGEVFYGFAHPNAALDMAQMILSVIKTSK